MTGEEEEEERVEASSPGPKTWLHQKRRPPPQVQTREEEKEDGQEGRKGRGGVGVEINNMLVSINLASI